MGSDSVGHRPDGAWKFDAAVTDCFDDMLARSIPDYEGMMRTVDEVGRRFVVPNTDVVDLGCSRGRGVEQHLRVFGAQNRYVLCDESEPMLDVCRQKFEGWGRSGVMRILNHDLRTGLPGCRASLVLSVLTLQFVPMEYRPTIIADVFSKLVPGGAFILVEKVIAASTLTQEHLAEVYRAHKLSSGYSEGDVDEKRRSLEHVLVPVTSAWNEELLEKAGFRDVECIWRHINFAAWLAVK